jgi:hypothetical protein
MSEKTIEVKVITYYYDQETAKHEPSPITSKEIDSWKSAKAFNPEKLQALPVQTLLSAIRKLF